MNKKNKKIFEELKKKLTIDLLNMENKRIPVFDLIPKMQFNGKGLYLTHDMIEKKKLTNDDLFYYVCNRKI